MRSATSILCLFAVAQLGLTTPAAAACEPDGEVRFICGPVNPEDLVAVPGTPWIVVSAMGMEEGGRLHLADTRDHTTQIAFPLPSSEPRHDRETFGACPGPLTAGFQPHGLSLRPATGGTHMLYVVRHGAREAVEVFELDVRGSEPTLTWVGCVVAPEGVGLNSVAHLPAGAFAVTNFNMAQGEVWEWRPGADWTKVPGSESPGPNGLEASPDGRWLYIGGWGTQSLIRLSRGREPVERDAVPVGFHVDNVRRSPDGSLLAAGQLGASPAVIGACLQSRRCDGVSTRVARVDPEALTAEELLSYPSNERIVLGTVALRVGDEIWVGQVAGGDRIGRFAVRD